MRSAQVLFVRAALLGTVLLSAGCFRPRSSPAATRAAATAAARTTSRATRPTTSASTGSAGANGTGGLTGTGGKGGTGTGGTGTGGMRDAGPDMAPCLDPVANPNCPSDAGFTGMCDPVCNKGCGPCSDKCSVNMNGNLTCNPLVIPAGARTVGVMAHCTINSPQDNSKQSDNCEPGEVCMTASTCPARCYQFCRTSTDCANNASCTVDAGGGQMACDVPPVACNPLAGATNTAICGGSAIGCYLSSSSNNTLCDCQFKRADGMNGVLHDPCTHSRDCFDGFVCVDALGVGTKECYPVCLLSPPDSGTGPGSCQTTCSPLPSGNTTYGYCIL